MDKTSNIDQLFKEGMQKGEIKAPVGAWDRLNAGLAIQSRKNRMVLFGRIAAVALIFLAFGAGYLLATYQANDDSIVVDSNFPELTTPDYQIEFPQFAYEKSPLAIEFDDVGVLNKSIIKEHNIDQGIGNTNNEQSSSRVSDISNELATLDKVNFNKFVLNGNIAQRPVTNNKFWNIATVDLEDIGKEVTYSYGEDDISKSLNWSIGARIAPTYSYRDISSEYGADQVNTLAAIDQYNQNEKPLLSYAGGMDLNLELNKKWSIQSGVYFSRIGQVNTNALVYQEDNSKLRLYSINTSTGDLEIDIDKIPENVRNIDPPKDGEELNSQDIRVIQNFDLFEVPFHMNYRLLDKKITFDLTGGLSPAFLIDNSTVVEIEQEKLDIGNTPNLNNFFVNSLVGIGVGYQFNKNLSLNVEPVFKYALSPINRNSELDYHPYYLSWFTGLTYSF